MAKALKQTEQSDSLTIKAIAKQNIEAFKKGGGFIFNNPHNIQSNVKPENIVALFDAAAERGKA